MKQILTLCLLGLGSTQAQPFYDSHILSNSQQVIDFCHVVRAADIDGDLLLDVVVYSKSDSKLSWFKNLGNGSFSLPYLISSTALWPHFGDVVDLNSDNKPDLLVPAYNNQKIVWYENQGGGSFSSPIVVETNAPTPRSAFAADLDNDADLDIISSNGDKIAWYENQGSGNFSVANSILVNSPNDHTGMVSAADMDGDGLKDILLASLVNSKLGWFKNMGSGVFSSQNTIHTGALYYYVNPEDLDNDGDQDVVSSDESSNAINWYENQGGGVFVQHTISTQLNKSRSACIKDINGDGMKDIVTITEFDNEVSWFENLGLGVFSSKQIISTSAYFAYAVWADDLDGDGDHDVISGSGNEVEWYENKRINIPVNITNIEGANVDFISYPNPTRELLNIDYTPNQKIVEHTYTVFDLQGKQIQKGILQLGKNALNISQLPAGHYMIKTPVGTQPFEVVR